MVYDWSDEDKYQYGKFIHELEERPRCIECGRVMSLTLSSDGIHCNACGNVFKWRDADQMPNMVWANYFDYMHKRMFPRMYEGWFVRPNNEGREE